MAGDKPRWYEPYGTPREAVMRAFEALYSDRPIVAYDEFDAPTYWYGPEAQRKVGNMLMKAPFCRIDTVLEFKIKPMERS